MIDYQEEIEQILQCLKNEDLVLFPTKSSWVIAVDGTSFNAVQKLNNIVQIIDNHIFIIYFSDERMMMQHVASIDLELFNFLDEQTQSTAIFCNHILGVAENALENQDAAFTLITDNDDFTKAIIKRFRKPLYSFILPKSVNNKVIESFSQIPNNLKKQINYVFPISEFQESSFQILDLYRVIDNQFVIVNN